jgi:pSer/pThr/pTyr-binding forkhead associated (FHA) protein
MRLVALNEGLNIPLDKPMIVVGRHPRCDTRLHSNRVSRRHCCMSAVRSEVVVKDLGSTNGIRINGHRVRIGRLRPGDVLSIADSHYVLDVDEGKDLTLDELVDLEHSQGNDHNVPLGGLPTCQNPAGGDPYRKQADLEAQSASGCR